MNLSKLSMLFKFESHKEPLATRKVFLKRFSRCLTFGFIFMTLVILIGMIGYHYFEDMNWINAFANSALTLADMGLISPIVTQSGKIFAGIYALLSGLIFFSVVGIIFSPLIHRLFHKFHLDRGE